MSTNLIVRRTPSPWVSEKKQSGVGYWIVSDYTTAGFDDEMVVANLEGERPEDARLLAAAPELLEALREIVNKWGCPNTPEWHKARAAISKAEGEQQ